MNDTAKAICQERGLNTRPPEVSPNRHLSLLRAQLSYPDATDCILSQLEGKPSRAAVSRLMIRSAADEVKQVARISPVHSCLRDLAQLCM